MFRAFSKVPLRRCIHTSSSHYAPLRLNRWGMVMGASAVATSYFACKALYGGNIALDSAPPPSQKVPETPKPSASTEQPSTATQPEPSIPAETTSEGVPDTEPSPEQTPEESEGSGGAFNPETGEINWDCPCLGGMAHGPCGMQFREAFSCFIFSEKEPKGIDCVELFKKMQDCFREHPEVYGEDIMADDDDDEQSARTAPDSDSSVPSVTPVSASDPLAPSPSSPAEETPAPSDQPQVEAAPSSS